MFGKLRRLKIWDQLILVGEDLGFSPFHFLCGNFLVLHGLVTSL